MILEEINFFFIYDNIIASDGLVSYDFPPKLTLIVPVLKFSA